MKRNGNDCMNRKRGEEGTRETTLRHACTEEECAQSENEPRTREL